MPCAVDDARALAGDGHAAWSESFNEMFMLVAGAFSNARVRWHGRAYVLGLLSRAERKNSWQLAEFAGDASPDGMQRLLNFSPWDEDAVRDALARYVAAAMGDAAAVLAVDETGFLKKARPACRASTRARLGGSRTARSGVRGLCHAGRGTGADRPGAVPAGEVGVRPGPVPGGRDRRRGGVRDEAGAGAEDDRPRAGGRVPFSWVAGDEVYGGNPGLRGWPEQHGIAYVMAVACSDVIPVAVGGMRADEAAGLVPAKAGSG
jgi:DDE superfamily endonuclease